MRFHLTQSSRKLLARVEAVESNRREDGESGPSESASRIRLRYGQAISLVHTLARRRNKDGEPYIFRDPCETGRAVARGLLIGSA